MASQIAVAGADVAGLWTDYINRDFVPGLKANLLFADYAMPSMIPKGQGFICIWNVPTMREGSVTPLTVASSGAATNMVTITKVTVGLTSYGEWFEIDDLAEQTEITEALDQYRDIVAYAGSTAIDKLIRNAADDTVNRFYPGDTSTNFGTTLDATDNLKALDLPIIAAYFNANNAVGWDKLGGDFMLAIHPNVEKLFATHVTTGALSWANVMQHTESGYKQLVETHKFVAKMQGITILRTTMIATVTQTGVAAYVNLALAKWGVGWLGLGQNGPKKPEIKIKRPGPQTTSDPLDMKMTMGWKVQAAAKLLDSSRALVVYSAV